MKPPEPTPDREMGRALQWVRRSGAESELLAEVAREVARQRRRRWAGAGGGVIALGLLAGLWLRPSSNFRSAAVGPATAFVSEPHREQLPDGSIVELRAGAQIAHVFDAERRHVTLLRGEAHFEVTKDPARPFVVRARDVDVRAVGTAFAVDLGEKAVEVVVTHGRVAVEPAAAQIAFVDAGQRARAPTGGASSEVSTLSAAEAATRLAWRVPQLEFSRTPLAEALALINARGAARGQPPIEVQEGDPAWREIQLSGILAADNTDGFLLLLETNFGIRSDRSGPRITLRPTR